MKTTLEEIVSGHHNDANCKKFQKEHQRIHGKAPQPCKFKDHPEQIQKLLEKITIEDEIETESQDTKEIDFEPQSSKNQETVQTVQDESERSKLGFRKRLKNFFKRK